MKSLETLKLEDFSAERDFLQYIIPKSEAVKKIHSTCNRSDSILIAAHIIKFNLITPK